MQNTQILDTADITTREKRRHSDLQLSTLLALRLGFSESHAPSPGSARGNLAGTCQRTVGRHAAPPRADSDDPRDPRDPGDPGEPSPGSTFLGVPRVPLWLSPPVDSSPPVPSSAGPPPR